MSVNVDNALSYFATSHYLSSIEILGDLTTSSDVRERQISSYNVVFFGLKGDGVTDNSGPLTKLLDLIIERGAPGSVLYFPKGTYCFVHEITLDGTILGNISILGDGNDQTLIKRDTAATYTTAILSVLNMEGASYESFTIDGNVTFDPTITMDTDGFFNATFDHCTGCLVRGVRSLNTNGQVSLQILNGEYNTVAQCSFSNAPVGLCILGEECTKVKECAFDNIISDGSTNGIRISGGFGNLVNQLEFNTCDRPLMVDGGSGHLITSVTCSEIIENGIEVRSDDTMVRNSYIINQVIEPTDIPVTVTNVTSCDIEINIQGDLTGFIQRPSIEGTDIVDSIIDLKLHSGTYQGIRISGGLCEHNRLFCDRTSESFVPHGYPFLAINGVDITLNEFISNKFNTFVDRDGIIPSGDDTVEITHNFGVAFDPSQLQMNWNTTTPVANLELLGVTATTFGVFVQTTSLTPLPFRWGLINSY